MLRLAGSGTSSREIAAVLGIARSTVQDNLQRAAAIGLSWPLPGELTDDALENKLFARNGIKQGTRRRVEPNWADLAVELKKPGVTLLILWEEYRGSYPEGYGYSRFCELFRSFKQRLSPTMRQEHAAGDKVFVDYSGKKIPIVDRKTGEIREAEIFVAVLGASSFTYAEATWTQTLPDWIGSHVRMFRFFDGVPRLIVPDNLKSGVNHASFYDPEINRSYGMMASHYGVGVLPARPKKPRDKSKVENGVRFAQTCILGRLRKQTFFSLAEANAAIRQAVSRPIITSSLKPSSIPCRTASFPSPAFRVKTTNSPNGVWSVIGTSAFCWRQGMRQALAAGSSRSCRHWRYHCTHP
ncbi:integrase catalytic subunit (plasmid) [Rhizobium grahamii CCGE 502]|uniref:Integrase catalytic subunit n=1 Tax=Rhizobium grahamii CCGE 502 TaxID=990285 RepID=S3HJN1_9HYPH|nr:integrase catalytic subunit [Rhizobium grahamii CCGE 502]